MRLQGDLNGNEEMLQKYHLSRRLMIGNRTDSAEAAELTLPRFFSIYKKKG